MFLTIQDVGRIVPRETGAVMPNVDRRMLQIARVARYSSQGMSWNAIAQKLHMSPAKVKELSQTPECQDLYGKLVECQDIRQESFEERVQKACMDALGVVIQMANGDIPSDRDQLKACLALIGMDGRGEIKRAAVRVDVNHHKPVAAEIFPQMLRDHSRVVDVQAIGSPEDAEVVN